MHPELGRIIRFAVVGLSSTGVYFGLLWALRGLVPSVLLLTALCYLASMVYNYVLQSFFTFKAGRPTRRTLVRFVLMHMLAMALNSGLMEGLVNGLRIPMFVAQIAVTGLISVMVFLISKHWVYHQTEEIGSNSAPA
jgi:putative flippase GtrA